jgi:hypothetical protein
MSKCRYYPQISHVEIEYGIEIWHQNYQYVIKNPMSAWK